MVKELNKVSEVRVTYSHRYNVNERPQISKSEEAYSIMVEYWNSEKIEFQEEFKMLLLNRANRILGVVNLSQGGTTGTAVDIKIAFATALKGLADKMIIIHNHPSGNLEPSRADVEITRKFVEAGKLLEVQVADHLIITKHGYYSLADNGLM